MVIGVRIVPVIHDVSSNARIVDFAKVMLNYRDVLELVVFSRLSGGAAQYGLAEASKLLFKENIPHLIVMDLNEISDIGIVSTSDVVIQFSRALGNPFKRASDVVNGAADKAADKSRRIVLVVSGSETGFSKSEILAGAKVVYPQGIKRDIPPDAYIALFMHLLLIEEILSF